MLFLTTHEEFTCGFQTSTWKANLGLDIFLLKNKTKHSIILYAASHIKGFWFVCLLCITYGFTALYHVYGLHWWNKLRHLLKTCVDFLIFSMLGENVENVQVQYSLLYCQSNSICDMPLEDNQDLKEGIVYPWMKNSFRSKPVWVNALIGFIKNIQIKKKMFFSLTIL